ncbi:ABC transporter ATP-binding protein [Candidatus Cardinium hertigii]|nr:ABC transporter ATP-binding protein [Candidatus Cardinium hertigii]
MAISKKTNIIPRNIFAFILYFMNQQRAGFSLMFLTNIIWAANNALYPYFTKVLVDKMTKLTPGIERPMRLLALPLVGIILCFSISEIFARIYGLLVIYVWPQFRKNIRMSLFSYAQGHAHSYFITHLTGGLAHKIAELPRACENIVSTLLGSFFSTLLGFCISLCILLFKTPIIFSIILFSFVLLFVAITFVNMRTIKEMAIHHAEAISTLDGQTVDSLSCMLTVRLFARTTHERDYLQKYQAHEIKQSQKAAKAIQVDYAWKGLLSFLFISITFYTLVHRWNHKRISIGDVTLIASTFAYIMGSIWHSHFHLIQLAKEIGVSKAALSILSEPHSMTHAPTEKSLCVTAGSIHFKGVSFGYIPGLNIFNQLSVTIKGKQKIGLVGYSGSGKSTFINLLLRLYDLNKGNILIDNQDISCVSPTSLYKQIAVIPQNPILFHRTIFENIQYGRLDATEAEVLEAARLAYCDEFVQHLEKGWETIIGERGAKLSGGQQQRIAIARAILKNAPILIMDEATSSLDSITEHLIQTNLKDFMQQCTTLVIAHRLSTLNHMDRILVLHQGRIIEDGPMPELLAKKGHFSRLWQTQAGGLLPALEHG